MTREIGTRVWAARNTNGDRLYHFGFGTYMGDHPRPGWDTDPDMRRIITALIAEEEATGQSSTFGFIQDMTKRSVELGQKTPEEGAAIIAAAEAEWQAERALPLEERILNRLRMVQRNPMILLEGGGVVWGMECWWGPADDDTPVRKAKGRELVKVPAPHPPVCIQRQRTAGWKKPAGVVCCDRSTMYGNPVKVGDPGVPDAATAVARYREYLRKNQNKVGLIRAYLAGKNLMCWCAADQPCHARDVILPVAAGQDP